MTPERTQEIIEQLRGTCKGIHEVLNNNEEETLELCQAIDTELFCCSQCEWWCELSEESNIEGGICENCCPDND